MNDSAQPAVSVVLSTYNWSSVLRFSIASVLAQSLEDFELLVVGDCCTDDSEAVARSFGDPRIRWFNLPENTGAQFGPNNHGLAQARGRNIAYLGHDDLWHRDHLANLVRAIEAHNADMVYALTLDIGPPSMPSRSLSGLTPSGDYEWSVWAPPSSWLHRRDIVDRVGYWRDYMTILLPTDLDFLNRVFDAGCLIVPVEELTVFKFASAARTNAYVERRCDEQAAWWSRLCTEPELRYRELIEALKTLARNHPNTVRRLTLPSRAAPGSVTEGYRARRGLPRLKRRPPKSDAMPLFADRGVLRYLNAGDDIAPANSTEALHRGDELPIDGLFLGLNWYSLEIGEDGTKWRWIDTGAQIVMTRPSGERTRLAIDLVPGPGVSVPARMQLQDAAGVAPAEVKVKTGAVVIIDVPEQALNRGEGVIFSLCTEDGGRTIAGDPRVLNFRVFSLRWADDEQEPGTDVAIG